MIFNVCKLFPYLAFSFYNQIPIVYSSFQITSIICNLVIIILAHRFLSTSQTSWTSQTSSGPLRLSRWNGLKTANSFFFLIFFLVDFVIHWHESAMDIHVFPIPIPPPTSLSTWSLWVFPVQVRALVSCIRPELVICFTLDNIHVSMLFSWNIPLSPSPTESKSLFYTSVSLFLFCI